MVQSSWIADDASGESGLANGPKLPIDVLLCEVFLQFTIFEIALEPSERIGRTCRSPIKPDYIKVIGLFVLRWTSPAFEFEATADVGFETK